MIAGALPSVTAMVVACARGARGEPDDVSHRFVPRALRAVLSRSLRVASFGLVDHVSLRTIAVDAAVSDATALGVRQVVILGAGLDARAYRLRELRDSRVFEVDHPATQAWKRRRAARTAAVAGDLRHVAVDFERDDLGACLERGEHDAAMPTTWIWEGVTPYLTRGAIERTLDVVASRSAVGSLLAMTYGTPDLARGPAALGVLHPLVRPAFAAIGEPLRGLARPDEVASMVRARGFAIATDSGSRDWADAARRARPPIAIAERLLVATRR